MAEAERNPTGAAAQTGSRLTGFRCLQCLSALGEEGGRFRCDRCGATYDCGPGPGTLRVGNPKATFRQELDAEVALVEQLLEALVPPACTEAVIAAHAARSGFEIGNPVWAW